MEEKPLLLSFTARALPTGTVCMWVSRIHPPSRVVIVYRPGRSAQELISFVTCSVFSDWFFSTVCRTSAVSCRENRSSSVRPSSSLFAEVKTSLIASCAPRAWGSTVSFSSALGVSQVA